jgi:hypothetical protein
MQHDPRAVLWDVQQAAEAIIQFTAYAFSTVTIYSSVASEATNRVATDAVRHGSLIFEDLRAGP